MANLGATASIIKSQWQNPSDIFSLLLLAGGDVVQKAITRLAGVRITVPIPKVFSSAKQKHSQSISLHITPVAFSFGWVAYAFWSLNSVLGEQRLVPQPETDIGVINCDNGYMRSNKSWILGRLLRDFERDRLEASRREAKLATPSDCSGQVSLLIDLFVVNKKSEHSLRPSTIWWLCSICMLTQQFIAAIPFVLRGDWGPLLITVSGTVLALTTSALPQWSKEKWSGRVLEGKGSKTVALTRGNGSQYVMVLVAYEGAWDLESMATARHLPVALGTRWALSVLVALWTALLVTVTGLKQNTWFLLAVGCMGMVQNTVVAAVSAEPHEFNIDLETYKERPQILGYQYKKEAKSKLRHDDWKKYTMADAEREFNTPKREGEVRDVMGALMELEKVRGKCGAALLPVFFPAPADYEPSILNNQREKHFWKFAADRRAARK